MKQARSHQNKPFMPAQLGKLNGRLPGAYYVPGGPRPGRARDTRGHEFIVHAFRAWYQARHSTSSLHVSKRARVTLHGT